MPKFKAILLTSFLISFLGTELAFARAGGRSSGFGGGRSSSSYYSQGSRGSNTYQGGSYGNSNYAPINKSTTAKQNSQPYNQRASQNNAQPNNFNQQPSFFQRNPMMASFGAAIAGSYIGNMLFGNNSHAGTNNGTNGAGATGSNSGGGLFSGMLPIILLGLGIFFLFRFLKRNRENNSANTYNQGYEQQNTPFENNQGNQIIVNSIVIAESEKQKFADILIEIQTAWSLQDSERMKKFVTPEIAKYFFDALSQNLSQNLANKVEDVRVLSVEISESWQEEDLEYATAILEWSCIDYTINTEKAENDSSFVTEGDRNNPVKTSEAWTFVRYGANGKWILSAIQQIN